MALKLSPPWDIYAAEVAELFKYDHKVHVLYDREEHKIALYVDDVEKAEALAKLLPEEKTFGNITMQIDVIPANGSIGALSLSNGGLYKLAFRDNDAFSRVKVVHVPYMTNDITYVVFVKRVVQYYTDNLGDLYGLRSTLYQDIARDVFGCEDGVFFCTEPTDPVPFGTGSPLGEWP